MTAVPREAPVGDVVYDPNRTVSAQLTEIRTVLSRARTALEVVDTSPDIITRQGVWQRREDGRGAEYVGRETAPHPEHADMVAALRRTVVELARWERLPGKPRPS